MKNIPVTFLIILLISLISGCHINSPLIITRNDLGSDFNCFYGNKCKFRMVTKKYLITFEENNIAQDVSITLAEAMINPLQLNLGHYSVTVINKQTGEQILFSIPDFDKLYFDEKESAFITSSANTINHPGENRISLAVFKNFEY